MSGTFFSLSNYLWLAKGEEIMEKKPPIVACKRCKWGETRSDDTVKCSLGELRGLKTDDSCVAFEHYTDKGIKA